MVAPACGSIPERIISPLAHSARRWRTQESVYDAADREARVLPPAAEDCAIVGTIIAEILHNGGATPGPQCRLESIVYDWLETTLADAPR